MPLLRHAVRECKYQVNRKMFDRFELAISCSKGTVWVVVKEVSSALPYCQTLHPAHCPVGPVVPCPSEIKWARLGFLF